MKRCWLQPKQLNQLMSSQQNKLKKGQQPRSKAQPCTKIIRSRSWRRGLTRCVYSSSCKKSWQRWSQSSSPRFQSRSSQVWSLTMKRTSLTSCRSSKSSSLTKWEWPSKWSWKTKWASTSQSLTTFLGEATHRQTSIPARWATMSNVLLLNKTLTSSLDWLVKITLANSSHSSAYLIMLSISPSTKTAATTHSRCKTSSSSLKSSTTTWHTKC